MHIAINALLVYGAFSGVQHAIVHQMRAIFNQSSPHRFTVVSLRDVPIAEIIGPVAQPYDILTAPLAGGQRAQRILWEQWALPRELARIGIDLLYAPGYLLPLQWRGRSLVFIHDTIALSHPELCTTSNALNYRLLLPASARRAMHVAVPSHASAADVMRYCGVPQERVSVVPLGIEPRTQATPEEQQAVCHERGITQPFLLAVSTIEPKKNFDSLIRWFNAWKRAGIPHHLVIVGKWGWKYSAVQQAYADSPYREAIHFPGYLEQYTVRALMAAADALLMPSRYEGFGLPALEAMAAGTPVVVSDQGSLPEVAAEAGLVLPLHDTLWEARIPELLQQQDRLESMRQSGTARAAQFTWERTGSRLLELFERLE